VNRRLLTFAALLLPPSSGLAGPGDPTGPAVTIIVDAARPGEPLRPAWRFFGHGEPNYTYMRDDDLPAADARVELSIRGLPLQGDPVLVQHYRIDGDHSDAYEAWKRMGSPREPDPGQLAALERSAGLETLGSPDWRKAKGGALTLHFPLPRQAVSLVALRW
jgi:hypothetical protein